MIEIYPNLHIGDQADYDWDVSKRSGWSTVHACKEPCYYQANEVPVTLSVGVPAVKRDVCCLV